MLSRSPPEAQKVSRVPQGLSDQFSKEGGKRSSESMSANALILNISLSLQTPIERLSIKLTTHCKDAADDELLMAVWRACICFCYEVTPKISNNFVFA
jgi:hypothetical protein